MSGGIKLKLDVELAAFEANVRAYQAMTRKTAAETVRDISVMVLQAGAQKRKGAAVIPIAPANRDVLQMVRRYRHGVEELVQNARPEAPGDKALWLIKRPARRRPIAKSGDRRWWTFESAAEAKRHKKITYRGVGRAGFWAQLPELGHRLPGGVNLALASIPGLTLTVVRLEDEKPTITVSNRSVAVKRLADDKTPYILSKVTNRISGMAQANKRKYFGAFKESGGVVWRQTGSINGESFGEYIPGKDL